MFGAGPACSHISPCSSSLRQAEPRAEAVYSAKYTTPTNYTICGVFFFFFFLFVAVALKPSARRVQQPASVTCELAEPPPNSLSKLERGKTCLRKTRRDGTRSRFWGFFVFARVVLKVARYFSCFFSPRFVAVFHPASEDRRWGVDPRSLAGLVASLYTAAAAAAAAVCKCVRTRRPPLPDRRAACWASASLPQK